MLDKPMNRRTLIKGAAATGVMMGAAGMAMPVVGPVGAQEKNLKIAFSVPGLNFPFFVHMMNLAQQHCEELGGIDFIPLDGQQNGAPSSTKQTADLEAATAQGIDGLVISPNDAAALAPAVQAVIDAGIPVVTVDRTVTDVATLAHVGADNVEGGRIQGRYLIEILPDGGDVYELQGQPGATPAIDRHKGLDEVISAQDKVKIVVSQTAEFARDKAVTVFESALAGNPEPQAVVCANDDMAFGVSEVAQSQGLSIPILGFDSLPEALIAIKDGTMAATIEQFPGGQATQAIDILLDFLQDGTAPAEHDTFLTPIIITKDNLGAAERAAEAGVAGDATPAA